MEEQKKNIESLKQRATEMLNNNYSRKICDEELYTIICEWENVLSALKREKARVKMLSKINKEIFDEMQETKQALKTAQENLEIEIKKHKEYKEISKKLAEELYNSSSNICCEQCKENCPHTYPKSKYCFIDWARNEVLKDE